MRKAAASLITALVLASSAVVAGAPRGAVAVAAQPSLPPGLNFGLGNEPGSLGWMTSSGVPWKYRYTYLSAGVNTGKGWETWNSPSGAYASFYMTDSGANGYLPVFSYYELLQSNPSTGNDESSRDFSNLNNAGTMNAYYANFALLMQKAQAYGKPVIVQVEPDLWGYLEQRVAGGPASSLSASVNGSGYAGVAGIPDTAQGFAEALLKLRDQYNTNSNILLGIHVSAWGTGIDLATDTDPTVNPNAVADQAAAFIGSAGLTSNAYGTTWDLVFHDVADHDAAWYGDTSHWWDKTNATLPTFSRWLAFMARLHADTGRPLIVWQVPVGNQYFLTMNNTNGHYQDNRAEYFLAHPGDLQAAGIAAVLFGKANGGQTNYTDDRGDGVTNNNGVPTSGFQCNACNTHTAQVSDDDGGFLRIFVGQYYSCGTTPALTPVPAASATPTFYFAEGFTGNGFTETLSLFMPRQSGTATIDYFLKAGHIGPISVPLTAGQVVVESVNGDVGCNQEVSARVTLPAQGVVERLIHFNTGTWSGSTDSVGASQAATEWDFAEGSTLRPYSEYLTLQNPGAAPVAVTLHYFTDGGGHPVKGLTLPANSRTTVEMVSGSPTSAASCTPGAGGTCGVGPGLTGVSVQVQAAAPIIAERPFYVNGYSFGAGIIRDGHVAFGANGPATQWNFAEGTTLQGFNEYLTLENPGATAATVTLRYIDDSGTVSVRSTPVAAQSRATILVNDPALGVGPGHVGVSTQVTSDQPIVAERPMYMVHDFGTGSVNGAHDVVGAIAFHSLFGFAAASTAAGENDYLTIQNANSAPATVTITYYAPGGPQTRTVTVPANTRHTVLVFGTGEGVGAGVSPLGIVLSSTLPVLVEKPTYSSSAGSYGATDTIGYAPAAF